MADAPEASVSLERTSAGALPGAREGSEQVGAKLILVSTDWVFDGTQTGADKQ